MATVVVTRACTHGDNVYQPGDTVGDAKAAKALLAAGVAEEKKQKDTASKS